MGKKFTRLIKHVTQKKSYKKSKIKRYIIVRERKKKMNKFLIKKFLHQCVPYGPY